MQTGRLMHWIVANIKWIMVVSGVLTSTMLYATIAPDAALQSTFGETLDERLARNYFSQLGRRFLEAQCVRRQNQRMFPCPPSIFSPSPAQLSPLTA
jgi:hypothetical protein